MGEGESCGGQTGSEQCLGRPLTIAPPVNDEMYLAALPGSLPPVSLLVVITVGGHCICPSSPRSLASRPHPVILTAGRPLLTRGGRARGPQADPRAHLPLQVCRRRRRDADGHRGRPARERRVVCEPGEWPRLLVGGRMGLHGCRSCLTRHAALTPAIPHDPATHTQVINNSCGTLAALNAVMNIPPIASPYPGEEVSIGPELQNLREFGAGMSALE